MNNKNEKFINEFFLCAYIVANAVCIDGIANCIRDTAAGNNATGGIIINGILATLTAQRAIHYYRLKNNQK